MASEWSAWDVDALAAPNGGHPLLQRSGEILVIDDDPAIVSLLVSLLHGEEGFAVHTEYSAQRALDWQPNQAPALVFLDLTIPGEQADGVIAHLRARSGWEQVPVVICSGQRNLAAQARRLGATACLAKPFDLDAVASVAHCYVRSPDDPYDVPACYSEERTSQLT